MILVIGSRDDFVHVYRNINELIADRAIGPGPAQFSGPVEFFDGDGRRFAGEHDQQGNLLALNPTADSIDLPTILPRVRNTFGRVRSYVDAHPAEFEAPVKATLAQLPSLSTWEEVRSFLRNFVPAPDNLLRAGPGNIDPQSGWHNALHRAGVGHG